LPIKAFYPIHWDDLLLFFASPEAISARLTDKTIGVHLWPSSVYSKETIRASALEFLQKRRALMDGWAEGRQRHVGM